MFRKYAQLDPYERHKHLINEFLLKRPGDTKYLKRDDTKDKKDIDVIRENHRFLWDDSLSAAAAESWEQRLAKKYYDKLFKEYTICDLQRYIENKVLQSASSNVLILHIIKHQVINTFFYPDSIAMAYRARGRYWKRSISLREQNLYKRCRPKNLGSKFCL